MHILYAHRSCDFMPKLLMGIIPIYYLYNMSYTCILCSSIMRLKLTILWHKKRALLCSTYVHSASQYNIMVLFAFVYIVCGMWIGTCGMTLTGVCMFCIWCIMYDSVDKLFTWIAEYGWRATPYKKWRN